MDTFILMEETGHTSVLITAFINIKEENITDDFVLKYMWDEMFGVRLDSFENTGNNNYTITTLNGETRKYKIRKISIVDGNRYLGYVMSAC